VVVDMDNAKEEMYVVRDARIVRVRNRIGNCIRVRALWDEACRDVTKLETLGFEFVK